MVDFNKETTVGTPAIDIVRVLLVQKIEYVSDAWEDYYKKTGSGVKISLSLIRGRLFTLYLQLWAYLNRARKKHSSPEYIEKQIGEGNKKELWAITKEFIDILDKLKITRLDNIKEYDHTSVEAENKVKA